MSAGHRITAHTVCPLLLSSRRLNRLCSPLYGMHAKRAALYDPRRNPVCTPNLKLAGAGRPELIGESPCERPTVRAQLEAPSASNVRAIDITSLSRGNCMVSATSKQAPDHAMMSVAYDTDRSRGRVISPAHSPHRHRSTGSDRNGHYVLPRNSTLLEIQSLIKGHGDICADYEDARKSPEELKQIKNKALRRYYERLNEQVNRGGWGVRLAPPSHGPRPPNSRCVTDR